MVRPRIVFAISARSSASVARSLLPDTDRVVPCSRQR
jgi:hypothetical protein